MNWKSRTQNPRRLHACRVRGQTLRTIRDFFEQQGYLEVQTPLLVRCPGLEPHIRPFEVRSWSASLPSTANQLDTRSPRFLPTSPEFSMKKLLVGGLERIFQISQCFRDEPDSPIHLTEFTMLEWYQAGLPLEGLMAQTENLICFLHRSVTGDPKNSILAFQGHKIDLTPPWPKYEVQELFQSHLNLDLGSHIGHSKALHQLCLLHGIPATSDEEWDDLYFKLWLNLIEPKLPKDRPCFVTKYPPTQAALATTSIDSQGTKWANRFEFYIGGIEIGNAFHELTNPEVQHTRFIEDMKLRARVYGPAFPPTPIDYEFLAALNEGLPASSGIAVGVDRLVQLLADEPEIRYTVWIDPA